MLLSNPDTDPVLLRARLAERERELAALREEATDAAEAAAERLRAARQEAAALRRALDDAQALAVVPLPAESEPSPVAVPVAASLSPVLSTPPRRGLRRTVALPVWRLVRPVARPVLWRARTFLTADALRELAALRAAQDTAQQTMRDVAREAVQDALRDAALPPAVGANAGPPCRTSRGGPDHGLGLGDTAAERWLLTVALEAAPQPA